jgi:hypothetical protein
MVCEWFLLKSAKDQFLGVDHLGQTVPPCVWYGTTCWLVRIHLGSLPNRPTPALTLLRRQRWDVLLWWRFLLEACVAPDQLPVGLDCSSTARWESRYGLLCKDNISYNKVYNIKILVFSVHILTVCMTTWSWANIRWASGFGLKIECDIYACVDCAFRIGFLYDGDRLHGSTLLYTILDVVVLLLQLRCAMLSC